MGFCCSITLFFLSLATLQSLLQCQSQEIKSARLLDLVIRDYIFRSHKKHFKTGKLHHINLPTNLTGITVDAIRFRCGSFYRYGAKIHEFHVNIHTRARPCSERLILVRQNLGSNWSSSLYDDSYELSGYRLISPVVGLLAYNVSSTCKTSELKIQAGKKPITIDFNDDLLAYNVSSTCKISELRIQAGKKPITIDFNNDEILLNNTTTPGIIPLCARFDEDGSVSLSDQARPNVCVSTRNGHFGLVVESPLMPLRRKVSRWRVAVGGAIGAVLGGFLLSLLVVAMFVKSKKKARMEEMERRAYEEEALRVSMVGHVRAVTASGTRTLPVIEHFECRPAVPRSNSQGHSSTRKGPE